MAQTKNLKLYVTPTSDTTTKMMDWVQEMAASNIESNMVKIDAAYASLQQASTTQKANISALTDRTQALENTANDLRVDITGVQDTTGDLQLRMATAEGNITILQTTSEDLGTSTETLRTDADALRVDVDGLRSEVDVLNSSSATASAAIETMQSDIETLKTGAETSATDVQSLKSDVSSLSASTSALKSQVSLLSSNDTSLQTQLAELQEKVESGTGSGGVNFDQMVYDEDHFLHILADGEDVVEPVYIAGGGGGSSTGAIMKLLNTTGSSSLAVAVGYDATVSFRFSSVDDTESIPTGDGTATYTLDGEVVYAGSIAQGDHTYVVPAASLPEGVHTLSVSVTDTYSTSRTLNWTITAKVIALSTDIDDTGFYTDDILVRYTPIGSGVSKTTYFEMDGLVIHTSATTDTNVPKSYTIPAQTHGAHTLRVWSTAVIGGISVSTEPLLYDLVWTEASNMTPIISVKSFETPRQHTTADIRYTVYDPANLTTNISLYDGEELVTELNVDRTVQHWYYTPKEAGERTLYIKCGTYSEAITFTATELGVKVEEVTDGLVWKFDPDGRSNAEIDRDQWSDGDVVLSVPSDFRWNRGGWGTDEDGYPCFTVPAGNTVSFTNSLFSTDWKRTGHSFKLVFKTANVCNYDAQVVSCMNNGIGFTVNAQAATLYTQLASTTVHLCEDKYTELEWNVTSSSAHSEIVTWLQGIPSAVKIYESNDSFMQTPCAPIVVGSPDCDVRIYSMREYSTYLTDEEMFANWLADSPDGVTMLERYERNQILDDYGEIDPAKLAKLHPNLRILTLTCPRFTEGKKDSVADCTLRHVMGSDPNHCWTATGIIHKGQGTSSDNYGNSGRNMDFDLSPGTIVLDSGETITAYAMTDNSIPVNYFNLKVNVASSESANNAYLTREYQRFNPYLRAARQADPRVRDTMEFHPAVIFVQDLSGELFGDTKAHFYAGGDLGNSKQNFEAQGLNPDNPNECIVELSNNTDDVNRWKSDDLSKGFDGDGAVEFRYPDAYTSTMTDAFQRVLSWVVSTDPLQATNETLSSAITYDGTIYRTDSPEFRKAKFRAEFDDYFISDSVMFFYLFTERHTMVDNRAKNTFWHTEDGLHWDVCFNYDNDHVSVVVVKPFLIYGEGPEMGNAQEDY